MSSGSEQTTDGAGTPVARAPRVAVIGAADAEQEAYESARTLGRLLAEAGAVVICGGRGGVMEAVARGAAEAGGTSVGILPGSEGSEANEWITIPLPTGLGEARNAVVVRSAEAVVSVGGRWGTLSELSLAAKMGVPVSSIGGPPLGVEGVVRHPDAATAAAWAMQAASKQRSLRE